MTPTTDLQKLLAEATKGPWSISETSNPPLIFQSTRDGGSGAWIASIYADKPGDHDYHKANARLIAMAPDLAARVLDLEVDNKRLREANYKAFTDGMEAAAQICGSLAEVEYEDADGFKAATGCEAAIMRVVKEQRTEQARAALKGGE